MEETIELKKDRSANNDVVYTIWVRSDWGLFNKSIRSICLTTKSAKKLKELLDKSLKQKRKGDKLGK